MIGGKPKKRKWYSLIDKVYEMRNLKEAWNKVRNNRGSGGIDGITIARFEKQKELYLREIHRLLRQHRYYPYPVKRTFIPKPDGDKRPLGIPTVRDRVVQQALLNTLDRFKIFESKFLDCSFGFRPNRNAHQAIAKVEQLRDEGYVWVVDTDIQKFFDTVQHERLIDMIAEEISDGSVLRLIRAFLKSGVLDEGKLIIKEYGTPQGGVISPLLANIYLHPFDVEMTQRDYRMVRYADDFLVMCRTKEQAMKAFADAKEILGNLGLTLKDEKTRIAYIGEGIQFLGFKIYEKHKVPKEESVKKFKENIRRVTRRLQPVKLQTVVQRVNPIIRGWGNYFKIGNVNWLFKGLDEWVRMRLRWFVEKRKSYDCNFRIPNKVFINMGLVTLSSLIGFPLPVMGQRQTKAVYVNSVRTV